MPYTPKAKYICEPIGNYPEISDLVAEVEKVFQLDPGKHWIAGGAIVRTLEGLDISGGDVDIYNVGMDCFTNKSPLSHPMYNAWKKTCASRTTTIRGVKLSVMDFVVPDMRMALDYFDLEHCRVATNGRLFLYSEDALDCIKNKRLKMTGISEPTWTRIKKYNKRGYEVHEQDTKPFVDYVAKYTLSNYTLSLRNGRYDTVVVPRFNPPVTNYRTIRNNINRLLDEIRYTPQYYYMQGEFINSPIVRVPVMPRNVNIINPDNVIFDIVERQW